MSQVSGLIRFLPLSGVVGLVAALAFAPAASAADVSFKGKRINVIIGSSPGGGTDGTTRLVGRYLQKFLPGKPQMIYRNMPAGHGVKANNYFYNVVKRDGTYWIGGSSSYVDASNLTKKVVKYDPTKYVFIGGIDRGGSVVVARKSNLANLTDKSKKPVVAGVIDGTRNWAQMLVWGSEYLGWNIKFVVGYPGSSSLILAGRKGEIDMFGTSQVQGLKSALSTGKFDGFVQIGQFSNGKYQSRSSFKGVPVMADLIEGKLDGLAKKALTHWLKANQIDKFYALPPKVPANIAKTYRAAWAKAVKDPEFTKFGKFQFSVDFTAQTAEDVGSAIRATSYADPGLLKFVRALRVKHGLPAVQLSDQEKERLAKKLGGGGLSVKKVKLEAVKRGGRWLHFKTKGAEHKGKVSGSRTKVFLDGKKAKRNALKPGMVCDINYGSNGGEVSRVACSSKSS